MTGPFPTDAPQLWWLRVIRWSIQFAAAHQRRGALGGRAPKVDEQGLKYHGPDSCAEKWQAQQSRFVVESHRPHSSLTSFKLSFCTIMFVKVTSARLSPGVGLELPTILATAV